MKTTKNSSDPSEGNNAVSEISQQEKTVADSTDTAETFDLSLPLKKKRKGKIKVLHTESTRTPTDDTKPDAESHETEELYTYEQVNSLICFKYYWKCFRVKIFARTLSQKKR